jgi:galactokinase
VALALALLDGRDVDPMELALMCHRAENEVVGLPCGEMDQFAAVFSQPGSALLIDCRDRSRRAVPLPEGVVFVAVNSMVRHDLAASAYPARGRECREAARRMGVAELRDPPIESWRALDGVPLKRARHVVSENQRVEGFVDACLAGDPVRMGRLMVASHQSLLRDYEVSCAELDFLVATALSVQGVLGARMTGGGFGGCTVNLMAPGAESAFRERIAAAYSRNFGREAQFYCLRS